MVDKMCGCDRSALFSFALRFDMKLAHKPLHDSVNCIVSTESGRGAHSGKRQSVYFQNKKQKQKDIQYGNSIRYALLQITIYLIIIRWMIWRIEY